ncbi:type II toxin-antitoxin system VapC family toxin [Mucilaginibacter gilvus]|uniref:PIN domain-containing protein n=1 Tax=Mucilaginibacter gilvus TaxID=2305909 RepID=A0A444MT18_9SPHI|nr:PIN domain-containing protein [Mucilaginibacter gilvus]RWY55761.1 PIN domain-containing protein [Mucilaginibacter gilvus]
MGYKKVFIDSDIFLDVLLTREPFLKSAQVLLGLGSEKPKELCTSSLIMANVHYMVTKTFSKTIAKQQVTVLAQIITVLPFDEQDIVSALKTEHIDFEDTVQYQIAKKTECDLIISRNIKHYKKFDIPVLTAEQFLRTIL